MKFQVKVTKGQILPVLKKLYSMGYRFIEYYSPNVAYDFFYGLNYIFIDTKFPNSINGWHQPFNKVKIIKLTELDKFIDCQIKPIIVKLNNSYKATVNLGYVTVGCQTFSFDKIKELAAAVDKMEKNGK